MIRNWKRILPGIGIAILLYLVLKIGGANVVEPMKQADYRYIVYALPLFFVYLSARTLKWRILLGKQELHIPFLTLIQLYSLGLFYGSITPARVGEMIRIAYLRDELGISVAEAASNVLVDKLMDWICLLLMGLAGIILVLHEFLSGDVLANTTAFASGILLLLVFLLFLDKERSRPFFRFIYQALVPNFAKEKVDEPLRRFYNSLPGNRDLLIPWVLAAVSWGVWYTMAYLVALAFAIRIPFIPFLFISSLASTVGTIPISVSGLGTRDLTIVSLFSLYGVAPEKALSYSLFFFLCFSLIQAVGGLLSSVTLQRRAVAPRPACKEVK